MRKTIAQQNAIVPMLSIYKIFDILYFYRSRLDKPEMDMSDNLLKSASHIGKTAKLYCVASGAPTVTFSWSRSGTILPINSSNKYITYHNQVRCMRNSSRIYHQ